MFFFSPEHLSFHKIFSLRMISAELASEKHKNNETETFAGGELLGKY